MGKAVPKGIKSRARILLNEFPNDLGEDFEKNKKFVDSLKLPLYKISRNKIAGFIVRKVKKEKQQWLSYFL